MQVLHRLQRGHQCSCQAKPLAAALEFAPRHKEEGTGPSKAGVRRPDPLTAVDVEAQAMCRCKAQWCHVQSPGSIQIREQLLHELSCSCTLSRAHHATRSCCRRMRSRGLSAACPGLPIEDLDLHRVTFLEWSVLEGSTYRLRAERSIRGGITGYSRMHVSEFHFNLVCTRNPGRP